MPEAPQETAGCVPAWQTLQVRRHWLESRDTVALELMPTPGQRLLPFEAGAFVDVALPGGQGVRPYSLANAPHERDHYLLAVRLAPAGGGGSRAMHALRPGDTLQVSAPRNAFALHGGALHSVLLAGGIGVTPLLSMAGQLWRNAASFELHYAFRTPEQAAFLPRLRLAPYAHRVRLCSSGAGTRIDVPQLLARAPRLSHVYLCGPAGFMEAAAGAATHLGWPAERLHRECFDSMGRPTPPC